MTSKMTRLGLRFNPFEPASTGAPVGSDLWLPARWSESLKLLLDTLEGGQGTKALAILGEYGSGKTYLLRWLETVDLPRRRIRPFFFDNPGVQFYDLANSLLRQIGRPEFSKLLWEYLSPRLPGFQMNLFDTGLTAWLESVKRHKRQDEATRAIAQAIRDKGITSDGEIAYRLAQIVIDTVDQPYFQYQDFVAGRKTSIVAEGEEAPYFKAILRILKEAGNTSGIAFLLDEFEEISLQKRLSRKQAYDYLATLKRLINLTQEEDLWLIVSMIPQAADTTRQLEASLWDRFTSQGHYQFEIQPLNKEEAKELLQQRLERARLPDAKVVNPCFPFPEDFAEMLRPTTISSPRRLVKVAFYVIAEAHNSRVPVPFKAEFLSQIEEQVYPTATGAEGERQ